LSDVGVACVLGAACHIVFLAFNTLCVQILRLGGSDIYEAARLQQALILQVSCGALCSLFQYRLHVKASNVYHLHPTNPAQASQKTLPVAVAVIAGLVPSSTSSVAPVAAACSSDGQDLARTSILEIPGAAGLAAIAAVTAHLTQIIIDSLLLPHWAQHLKDVKAQQAGTMKS